MPRAPKGAHIYRRPGRIGWFAYLNREERHISLKTDDEAVAQSRLAEMLHNRRLRRVSKGTPNAEIFKECIERSETAHTKKTSYEYSLNLERIGTWLESRDIFHCEQINKGIVEDYKTSRHRFEKRSAARVNRELDAWKKAMRVAVELSHAGPGCLDWFAHLREPRPAPHQRGLSRVEINKLLKAIKGSGYRAMLRTIVGVGLRDDEMRHLQESDLQKTGIGVTPKPPGACQCCPKGWSSKSYRYRFVPASADTMRAAKAFVQAKDAINLDQKRVWKIVTAACLTAKIKHCSLHDLRRACASHWLASGIKLEIISKWLGHADLMTTMRYLRIIETEIPKGVKLPW